MGGVDEHCVFPGVDGSYAKDRSFTDDTVTGSDGYYTIYRPAMNLKSRCVDKPTPLGIPSRTDQQHEVGLLRTERGSFPVCDVHFDHVALAQGPIGDPQVDVVLPRIQTASAGKVRNENAVGGR